MNEIKILPADEKMIDKIAYVFVEAFETEGVNKYLYDFTKKDIKKILQRTIAEEAKLSLEDSHLILLAIRNADVVGGVILKKNTKISLKRNIKKILKKIQSGFLLVTKMNLKRVFLARKAFNLSQKIREDYYTLVGLAVHPAHQGQGIGKMLLTEVQKISEDSSDIAGVYLYTADLKNKLLYQRFGYQMIEERQGGDLTIYHMFRRNICC